MLRSTWIIILLTGLVCVFALSTAVQAVSPTKEAVQKWIAQGVYEQKIANWKAFREAGGCSPNEFSSFDKESLRSRLALDANAVDTARVLVILVDFPDYHYDETYYAPAGGPLGSISSTPQMFDSLLFSRSDVDPVYNSNGSMTEFYLENSYGRYLIQGDVRGWYTMPQNYSWYVDTTDGLFRSGYLATQAVDAAHYDGVDFSLYAEGSAVPAVIIVHAGPGAEVEGTYGIWSHKGSLSPSRTYDYVNISNYTIQPEEQGFDISTVGVFVHEWGHVLQAIDLYDIEDITGSDGLGRWSLMATGSWNNGGRTPSHFDAWSRWLTGFIDVTWLDANLANAPIPQVESEAVVYGLPETPGGTSTEYWLVENRQRVGFDYHLPGGGLCIYHVDNSVSAQSNPYRYKVALEQADGRNDLAFVDGNSGDGSDSWPGTADNHDFHDYSVPSARLNTGDTTEGDPSHVGVWEISYSDSLMTADLDVTYSRPYVLLFDDSITMTDNNDDVFIQGDTIELDLEVKNYMRQSFNPRLVLTTDNPDIEIIQNNVSMGVSLNPSAGLSNRTLLPVIFTIPDDFPSSLTSFTATVISDSLIYPSGDGIYQTQWQFDVTLGKPQIMLVDDDNGNNDEDGYENALERLGLPYVIWDKSLQSSPTAVDLAPFPNVFWMTGRDRSIGGGGGTITATDILAMKQHMDIGGNLVLAGKKSPGQVAALDPAFVTEYLHAAVVDSNIQSKNFLGLSNNVTGGEMLYMYSGSAPIYFGHYELSAINGGQEATVLTDLNGTADLGVCGVTFNGTYRTVFLSFPIEFLRDDAEHVGYMRPDSLIDRILTFFARGDVTAVEEDGDSRPLLPEAFVLEQNYPNPFNPATIITYSIAAGRPVMTDLSVFNILGRKVVTLVHEVQGPGTYSVTWDIGASRRGKIASGTYFYRLVRGETSETRKMLLLK